MSEIPLAGGDINVGENVVVRVGDTVRRPLSDRVDAVHALLLHFESVGFDGAPRFLGVDDRGREVLSFVEGTPALAPVAPYDDVVTELARLLRRMHDAQTGFSLPADAAWPADLPVRATAHSVVCHNDLFWPNVIFRDGRPVALIDWDLAAPAPPLYDVASAANFWVPLRPDDQAAAWGLPTANRGSRLRLLCDAYGLDGSGREGLLDVVDRLNGLGYEAHRRLGGLERRPGWAEMWDAGSGDEIQARIAWFGAERDNLLAFLR
ncbi:MAG TPA: phosphotransferase [Gaiella sp.]|nr:phosphotransferase [Gaiella sp.]